MTSVSCEHKIVESYDSLFYYCERCGKVFYKKKKEQKKTLPQGWSVI